MAELSTDSRNALPDSKFALPNRRMFPLTSESKARNALSGAERSLHAGNITQAEHDKVVAAAKHELATMGHPVQSDN